MPAARFWRVVGVETYAGGDLELSELHLYGASGRVDAAATLTSTIAPTAGTLAALQDDDTGTACRFSERAVRAQGFALVWDFGGAPADVASLRFGAADDIGLFAEALILQSSSDGLQWATVTTTDGRYAWPGPRAMTVVTLKAFSEVWSESFASGIPGGFATTLLDSGTLGITYDATNSAVILDATGYNTAWMFNMPEAQLGVKVEFDIEIITPTYGNLPYIGLALTGGPQLLQNIVSPGGTLSACVRSSTVDTLGLQATLASTSFASAAPASGRALWTFSSVPNPAGGRDYGFAVGTNDVVISHSQTPATALLKTGLFLRSCKVRLHGVRGFALVAAGVEVRPPRTVPNRAQIVASFPAVFSSIRSAAALKTARDVEHGGPGTVYGTTKTKGTPNLPAHARVVLLHQRSKLPVRETWSDPVTGAFVFSGIDTSQQFLTLAEDAAGNFRPVAANRLTPEVLT